MTGEQLDPKQVEIFDKIKKLLRLSEKAGTPEEAASAAAKAQELMLRYRLESCDFSGARDEQAGGGTPDEEVNHYSENPKVAESIKYSTWMGHLIRVLARHNNCQIVIFTRTQTVVKSRNHWGQPVFGKKKIGVDYRLIGRASDVEMVRFLYSHVTPQIEGLLNQHKVMGWIQGKTEALQFRIGVIETIDRRLTEMEKSVKQEYVDQHKGSALALYDQKSAKTLEKYKQIAEKEKFKTGSSWNIRQSASARECGREAGEKVGLNRPLAAENVKGMLR